MKTRAHVVISGRVQGISCRFRTAERVCEVDIAFWFRNIIDGRVEAIFEGDN